MLPMMLRYIGSRFLFNIFLLSLQKLVEVLISWKNRDASVVVVKIKENQN